MKLRPAILWYLLPAVAAVDLGYLVVATRPGAGPADVPPERPRLAEAPPPNAALAGDPVVLGAILPVSGDEAAVGEALRDALRMAADELNAADGIAGRPVRLLVEDGGCAEAPARAAARRLLDAGAAALIPACSAETLAAAATAKGSAALILSPAASAPEVSRAGPAVFRLVPSETAAKEATARYRRDHPGPYDLRPYFDEHAERAERFFRAYKARFGGDPLPPWYLANAYSAVFLVRDLAERVGPDPAAWSAALLARERWSGGAIDDLSFDRNGDPVWTRFVVSETRDGSRYDLEVVALP